MAHIGNMKDPVIFKDPLNQAAKVREYEEKWKREEKLKQDQERQKVNIEKLEREKAIQ